MPGAQDAAHSADGLFSRKCREVLVSGASIPPRRCVERHGLKLKTQTLSRSLTAPCHCQAALACWPAAAMLRRRPRPACHLRRALQLRTYLPSSSHPRGGAAWMLWSRRRVRRSSDGRAQTRSYGTTRHDTAQANNTVLETIVARKPTQAKVSGLKTAHLPPPAPPRLAEEVH